MQFKALNEDGMNSRLTLDIILKEMLEKVYPWVPARYKQNKKCGEPLKLSKQLLGFEIGNFNNISGKTPSEYTDIVASIFYEAVCLLKQNSSSKAGLLWNLSTIKSYLATLSLEGGGKFYIVTPQLFELALIIRNAASVILKTPNELRDPIFTGIVGSQAVESVTEVYNYWNQDLYQAVYANLRPKFKMIEQLEERVNNLSKLELNEDNLYTASNTKQNVQSLNDELMDELPLIDQLSDFEMVKGNNNPNRQLHQSTLKQISILQSLFQRLGRMINEAIVKSKIESTTNSENSENSPSSDVSTPSSPLESTLDLFENETKEEVVSTIPSEIIIKAQQDDKNEKLNPKYVSAEFNEILNLIEQGNYSNENIETILLKLAAFNRLVAQVAKPLGDVETGDRLEILFRLLPTDTNRLKKLVDKIDQLRDACTLADEDFQYYMSSLTDVHGAIIYSLEIEPTLSDKDRATALEAQNYNNFADEIPKHGKEFNDIYTLCRIQNELLKDKAYLEEIIIRKLQEANINDYYRSQVKVTCKIKNQEVEFNDRRKTWDEALADDYFGKDQSKPIFRAVANDDEFKRVLARYYIIDRLEGQLFHGADAQTALTNFHQRLSANLPILQPLLDSFGRKVLKNIAVILAAIVTLPLLSIGGVVAYKYLYGKREGEVPGLVKLADEKSLDANDGEPARKKRKLK